MAPRTAAAPAMSHFMSTIWSFVLSDSPPLSNVTPLPTSASVVPLPPFPCRKHDQTRRPVGAARHREQ